MCLNFLQILSQGLMIAQCGKTHLAMEDRQDHNNFILENPDPFRGPFGQMLDKAKSNLGPILLGSSPRLDLQLLMTVPEE